MNADYEKQLEAGISRELKRLPELAAPDSLVTRIMSALDRRSRSPWYQRSWQTWPPALRWTSFAVLLALFAGFCVAGSEMAHSRTSQLAMRRMEEHLSGLATIGNTLEALAGSGVLVLKKFGASFLISCSVALALGCSLCLAAGTIYLRLAFAKHEKAL